MPVGPAKFDPNRCNESPLRGEKPDFWPVSKNNTGSLPLRGILPVIRRSGRLVVCILNIGIFDHPIFTVDKSDAFMTKETGPTMLAVIIKYALKT